MNYYNEIDPYCAQWLRNLITAGLIPDGLVDERSIRDVQPDDLAGFTQCHFFAGIAGWSLALALAEWPADRPVWTGSCPCQPFSAAGARRGFDDERHLWPEWHRLIAERRPSTIIGENVARATDWIRLVRSDLEALGYAVGAMPIEAASVGANHRRDRFWFVADANKHARQQGWPSYPTKVAGGRNTGRGGERQNNVADTDGQRQPKRQECNGEPIGPEQQAPQRDDAGGFCDVMADADEPGLEVMLNGNARQRETALGASWWAVEPDVGRVAYGVPARVGKLRALGNAIVPQVAAEFIKAYLTAAPK